MRIADSTSYHLAVFTSWISHAHVMKPNGATPLANDMYTRTPQLQSAIAPDLSGEEEEDDDHY